MHKLSIFGCIGHKESSATRYIGGRLELDVDGGKQSLQRGQNTAVCPRRRQSVDADGQFGSTEERDKTSSEAEDTVLGSG